MIKKFIIVFIISLVLIMSIITGSGILPVPISIFIILNAILSYVFAKLFILIEMHSLNKIKKNIIKFLLSIILIIIIIQTYGIFAKKGLEYAKNYASELASIITDYKNKNSKWPSSLETIPLTIVKNLNKKDFLLFVTSKKNKYFSNIAGYFISYTYKENTNELPSLYVGRRDIRYEWDWNNIKWIDKSKYK